ncbi:hypothetical protein JW930_07190 [Candidatus Woesearchaeota archaeon]|nr:hypothetical protein [Candidatus Woesearchaeota archaeon]
MDVCIKKVNDEDWIAFKVEAAKNNLKTGEMFSKMVNEYKEGNEEGNWKKLVYRKKSLDDKDVMVIREGMKEFRKETEFRKTK